MKLSLKDRRWLAISYLIVLILIAYLGRETHAVGNIYFAQSSAGGNTGADCADARAWSTASASDWIAGNTLHACGTFTGSLSSTAVTSKGAGTSGSPITLKFESGAVFQAPAWNATNGAIDIAHQWVVIDGGANGVVQDTLNGEPGGACLGGTCTQQVGNSNLIQITAANVTVQNLTVQYAYVHTQNVNDTQPSIPGSGTTGVDCAANNCLVQNSVFTQEDSGVAISANNSTVQTSTFSFCNHCVVISSGASQTGNVVHDNDFSNMYNWDEPNNAYHHNYIFVHPGGSATVSNGLYYNNYFHGASSISCHTTAVMFLEFDNAGAQVFNNVWNAASNDCGAADGFVTGDPLNNTGPISVYNNTVYSAAAVNIGSCIQGADGVTAKVLNVENNIFINCSGVVWQGAAGTIDYNIYYGSNAYSFTLGSNAGNSTMAQWRTACSCDSHGVGLTTNPLINTTQPLTLQSGSPVRATGANPGVNLTSLGISLLDTGAPQTSGAGGSCGTGCLTRASSGAWDMGAYPFSASSGSASFVPSSINFGQINKGASSAPVNNSLFTMTGTGTATFSSETFSGPNAADFSLTTNGCNFPTGSVSAPGTCSVAIQFSPTAPVGTVETATYSVAYSGLTGSPATIALTGVSGATAASAVTFMGD